MKRYLVTVVIFIFAIIACVPIPASETFVVSTPTMLQVVTFTAMPITTDTAAPSLTPTATHTATPQIEIPLVKANGQPVIVDNRILFDFEIPYASLPSVQELEMQLNAEAWSPDFIQRLHLFLATTMINGATLTGNFDSKTVCNLPWLTIKLHGAHLTDRIALTYDPRVPCKKNTLPFWKVFAFRDDKLYVFGVTQVLYNPSEDNLVYRTTAFDGPVSDLLPGWMHDGQYISYAYEFGNPVLGESYMSYAARTMSTAKLKNGPVIYDPEQIDSAFQRNGIYDPYFDSHITVGQSAGGLIITEE